MVENNPGRAGEIAMALLGKDIPAIGPRLKSKTDAMLAVKEFVRAIVQISLTGLCFCGSLTAGI